MSTHIAYSFVGYRTLLLNLQIEIHNTTIYSNRAGQWGAVSIYNDHNFRYGYYSIMGT